jgi:DNA-binding NtrC family response regulator
MGAESASILVVDDDATVGSVLVALLTQAGHRAEHVPGAKSALTRMSEQLYDVVISDVRMPEVDGLSLLKQANARWPDLPIVLLTAHGSVPLAVEAMKSGATDFLLKPFDREEILFLVDKILASAQIGHPPAPAAHLERAGSDSPAMREVTRIVQKVAPGNATVLIRGETGTGKERIARAVHMASPRHDKPFVRVHCGALPDALLESELFGYEKGAFTGAAARKPGRVELAHAGTLFLDEIGDVTPAFQIKLLRVLQEREFERVGGVQTIKVDVRVLAATHRNLEQMVKDGSFREDLFYRLNVVPIWLPPLRERPGDVRRLAVEFCAALAEENAKPGLAIEPEALDLLESLAWPGNVRQLQNLVERLTVLSEGATIAKADVEREIPRETAARESSAGPALTLSEKQNELEREAIVEALQRARNNRTLAARILGVSRRTLYKKLATFEMT